jgi:hypothetical protein
LPREIVDSGRRRSDFGFEVVTVVRYVHENFGLLP